jgi:hypothetical protein
MQAILARNYTCKRHLVLVIEGVLARPAIQCISSLIIDKFVLTLSARVQDLLGFAPNWLGVGCQGTPKKYFYGKSFSRFTGSQPNSRVSPSQLQRDSYLQTVQFQRIEGTQLKGTQKSPTTTSC